MPETTVALATCRSLPHLDDDERLLLTALGRRGIEARAEVWNNADVGWEAYSLVVIRSTWDYSQQRDEFLLWTAMLPRVLNSHRLVAWNTDKAYLCALAAAGIPVVPTTWYQPAAQMSTFDLPAGEIVVKPAISAGSRDTARYISTENALARQHVIRLLRAGRTVMVQPYIKSVDMVGETGLVYIDGRFSHAVRKGPMLPPGMATGGDQEARLFVPEVVSPITADAAQRTLADATLAALGGPREAPLYARVDMVRGEDGAPVLLELELTEPSLFFGCGDGAAERLAEAIRRRIDAAAAQV